jgi:hypothetical protein
MIRKEKAGRLVINGKSLGHEEKKKDGIGRSPSDVIQQGANTRREITVMLAHLQVVVAGGGSVLAPLCWKLETRNGELVRDGSRVDQNGLSNLSNSQQQQQDKV